MIAIQIRWNTKKSNLYFCLDKIEPSSLVVSLVYIGVAIILGLALFFLVLLFWKRDKEPIRNASPIMCYTIVVGVVFCAVSVMMWTKATDTMCALRGWLISLGLDNDLRIYLRSRMVVFSWYLRRQQRSVSAVGE